jgi:hypothetical protein
MGSGAILFTDGLQWSRRKCSTGVRGLAKLMKGSLRSEASIRLRVVVDALLASSISFKFPEPAALLDWYWMVRSLLALACCSLVVCERADRRWDLLSTASAGWETSTIKGKLCDGMWKIPALCCLVDGGIKERGTARTGAGCWTSQLQVHPSEALGLHQCSCGSDKAPRLATSRQSSDRHDSTNDIPIARLRSGQIGIYLVR